MNQIYNYKFKDPGSRYQFIISNIDNQIYITNMKLKDGVTIDRDGSELVEGENFSAGASITVKKEGSTLLKIRSLKLSKGIRIKIVRSDHGSKRGIFFKSALWTGLLLFFGLMIHASASLT